MTLEQRKLELITWIAGLANEKDLYKLEILKLELENSQTNTVNDTEVKYHKNLTTDEEILNFLEESSKNEEDTLVLHTSVQDILGKNID